MSVDALEHELGPRFSRDPAVLAAYRHDQCLYAEAGQPLGLVRARSVDDVVATLRICHADGVPVVVRGAGTGLAGAANALDGSVVLSLAALDRIVAIDPEQRLARVEPGVINADLDRAAGEVGLAYAPDPGSRAISSIGGNIATNAGGMCCAKYGVTADHLAALTAVCMDGTVFSTGSVARKNVTGLDLVRLLTGSEGTLAVIVEATVRLVPRPARIATLVAEFDEVNAAVDAVVALSRTVTARAVELMDRTTVEAVERHARMGLASAGALLIVQCDGPALDSELAAVENQCRLAGAREVYATADAEEGEAFMAARAMALPALEAQGTVLLDDVAVPVAHLPRLLAAIEQIARTRGVTIGTFGHAADGNMHPTIVHDAADARQVEAARAAFADIVEAAVALDGSLSGEHGIGSLKLPWVSAQLSEPERRLMARVKEAFDPRGLLNPGRGY